MMFEVMKRKKKLEYMGAGVGGGGYLLPEW